MLHEMRKINDLRIGYQVKSTERGISMAKRFYHVYRFKITLQDIEPKIWRRIEVPETYTFWDLHVAIQDVMGWLDCHLHQFLIKDPRTRKKVEIGLPDEDYLDDMLAGWEEKIANYFTMENKSADYVYDFGDDWFHKIQLEQIHPVEKGQIYPLCLKGERACPPEDCGGTMGYQRVLDILNNPKDEEFEDIRSWVGEDYDPEHFNVEEVEFDDPEERFANLLG